MNILIRMAFLGTGYHGFQVQAPGRPTICGTFQDALQAVLGTRPDVKGCSRTDAGVHARAYCLNFHYDGAIPPEKLPLALNQNLPGDIRVHSATEVPPTFHARYSAVEKEYTYELLNAAIDDPFTRGQYHRITRPLDENRMQAAAALLRGTHDFATFMNTGSPVNDTRRTLTHLSVARRGQRVVITAAADGFLYNMVRILAGTLADVGSGKTPPKAVVDILAARNRQNAGPTLPACGLFLHRVVYPGL
ncbi:tRNA pseudouridine(38-40) synthase TruA [Ruminococcaceae bacterium OttesenSCG-928-O06]|nr:tRNA pseudouridine(38-40) synthase TruA [Ruminococcaceae bacterium OttesenSCG-928-O06]